MDEDRKGSDAQKLKEKAENPTDAELQAYFQANADRYAQLARTDADHWMKVAADGDHYRLAFDKPNTWSQKYNLVWDRILGLGLFPPNVAKKEMSFYRRAQERYGLPLDTRRLYSKLDWITWTATLTGSRSDFEALINPVVNGAWYGL